MLTKSLLFQVFPWYLCVFASANEEEQFLINQHLRVTALPERPFLQFSGTGDSATDFSGYLGEMFEELSVRANFTYELHRPSGFGSHCVPRLTNLSSSDAYGIRYSQQYDCGVDDVNEMQGTEFTTDLYLGMFYITPSRQKVNKFTVPFAPPFKGTPAMFGVTTGIRTIDELVVQQHLGNQPPVCVAGSTALPEFLQESYKDPEIKLKETFFGFDELHVAMGNGTCPISIVDAPLAANFVLGLSETGRCLASNGKPIGLIGEPMEWGLSHYAIGIGSHVDSHVRDSLSFWINTMMVDGDLARFYEVQGGTGRECGYVLFPRSFTEELLSDGEIVAAVLVPLLVFAILLFVWHKITIRKQQSRYKIRFVQQIARNIEIGPSPGSIRPEKLSEEILHIGHGKSFISKEDLRTWLSDVKMEFLSEKDFDALWNAIDADETGHVDPVEFVVFLSACGPEFSKVYEKQRQLPKRERLKLAARRLSNIALMGEDGVRRIQNRLDRNSGGFAPSSSHSMRSFLTDPKDATDNTDGAFRD